MAGEQPGGRAVRCAVLPACPQSLREAVAAAGGEVVDAEAAEALVWTDPLDPEGLAQALATAPGVRWVQLPFAGVEPFAGVIDRQRAWTSAKGAYAQPVAEHALALALAGFRRLVARARAREWGPPAGRRLTGARVTIAGGGGIATELLRLLAPFEVEATVVKRHPSPLVGAARVVGPADLAAAVGGAAVVVLALPLTPETRGIVDAELLARMERDAWLVNVARGEHVVTDDLVDALERGVIGGAALDVTDPEPLPAGHRLWDLDNCLVTPHVSNTPQMAEPLFADRVRRNVERWASGHPLLGLVDPVLGY